VNYALHPEAALEHEEQVAYYEAHSVGLGRRYHAAFRAAILRVCDAPHRFRIIQAPGIRRVSLRGFPFAVIFRDVGKTVQVLAIAPHRKRPAYWTTRI